MLDLRLLRFFIAIYEEKNITAAAARCHVSQPSLSAGLRQLEESLGDSLFIRGKKGVEAKDPAHYLYPHAVKLVEEARRLPTLFRQKATRARLNMASCPTSADVGWRDCFGGCRGCCPSWISPSPITALRPTAD